MHKCSNHSHRSTKTKRRARRSWGRCNPGIQRLIKPKGLSKRNVPKETLSIPMTWYPLLRITNKLLYELSWAFFSAPEMIYWATSAQHLSLSASSSGISIENSCSKAMTSSTLSKLSRLKSFWKSALSVTYKKI